MIQKIPDQCSDLALCKNCKTDIILLFTPLFSLSLSLPAFSVYDTNCALDAIPPRLALASV